MGNAFTHTLSAVRPLAWRRVPLLWPLPHGHLNPSARSSTHRASEARRTFRPGAAAAGALCPLPRGPRVCATACLCCLWPPPSSAWELFFVAPMKPAPGPLLALEYLAALSALLPRDRVRATACLYCGRLAPAPLLSRLGSPSPTPSVPVSGTDDAPRPLPCGPGVFMLSGLLQICPGPGVHAIRPSVDPTSARLSISLRAPMRPALCPRGSGASCRRLPLLTAVPWYRPRQPGGRPSLQLLLPFCRALEASRQIGAYSGTSVGLSVQPARGPGINAMQPPSIEAIDPDLAAQSVSVDPVSASLLRGRLLFRLTAALIPVASYPRVVLARRHVASVGFATAVGPRFPRFSLYLSFAYVTVASVLRPLASHHAASGCCSTSVGLRFPRLSLQRCRGAPSLPPCGCRHSRGPRAAEAGAAVALIVIFYPLLSGRSIDRSIRALVLVRFVLRRSTHPAFRGPLSNAALEGTVASALWLQARARSSGPGPGLARPPPLPGSFFVFVLLPPMIGSARAHLLALCVPIIVLPPAPCHLFPATNFARRLGHEHKEALHARPSPRLGRFFCFATSVAWPQVPPTAPVCHARPPVPSHPRARAHPARRLPAMCPPPVLLLPASACAPRLWRCDWAQTPSAEALQSACTCNYPRYEI